MKEFILTALSYVGWFFVACAAVVALTWFCLGLRNLAKIYLAAWRAKREYAKEIPDFPYTSPPPEIKGAKYSTDLPHVDIYGLKDEVLESFKKSLDTKIGRYNETKH